MKAKKYRMILSVRQSIYERSPRSPQGHRLFNTLEGMRKVFWKE